MRNLFNCLALELRLLCRVFLNFLPAENALLFLQQFGYVLKMSLFPWHLYVLVSFLLIACGMTQLWLIQLSIIGRVSNMFVGWNGRGWAGIFLRQVLCPECCNHQTSLFNRAHYNVGRLGRTELVVTCMTSKALPTVASLTDRCAHPDVFLQLILTLVVLANISGFDLECILATVGLIPAGRNFAWTVHIDLEAIDFLLRLLWSGWWFLGMIISSKVVLWKPKMQWHRVYRLVIMWANSWVNHRRVDLLIGDLCDSYWVCLQLFIFVQDLVSLLFMRAWHWAVLLLRHDQLRR